MFDLQLGWRLVAAQQCLYPATDGPIGCCAMWQLYCLPDPTPTTIYAASETTYSCPAPTHSSIYYYCPAGQFSNYTQSQQCYDPSLHAPFNLEPKGDICLKTSNTCLSLWTRSNNIQAATHWTNPCQASVYVSENPSTASTSSNGVAVGLGVAFGVLCALVIAVLAYILYRKRKTRLANASAMAVAQTTAVGSGPDQPEPSATAVPSEANIAPGETTAAVVPVLPAKENTLTPPAEYDPNKPEYMQGSMAYASVPYMLDTSDTPIEGAQPYVQVGPNQFIPLTMSPEGYLTADSLATPVSMPISSASPPGEPFVSGGYTAPYTAAYPPANIPPS